MKSYFSDFGTQTPVLRSRSVGVGTLPPNRGNVLDFNSCCGLFGKSAFNYKFIFPLLALFSPGAKKVIAVDIKRESKYSIA